MTTLDRDWTRAELRALAAELATVRERAEALRRRVQDTYEFAAMMDVAKSGRETERGESLALLWCGTLDEVRNDCARLAGELAADSIRDQR